jgi:hypothetical protein
MNAAFPSGEGQRSGVFRSSDRRRVQVGSPAGIQLSLLTRDVDGRASSEDAQFDRQAGGNDRLGRVERHS